MVIAVAKKRGAMRKKLGRESRRERCTIGDRSWRESRRDGARAGAGGEPSCYRARLGFKSGPDPDVIKAGLLLQVAARLSNHVIVILTAETYLDSFRIAVHSCKIVGSNHASFCVKTAWS